MKTEVRRMTKEILAIAVAEGLCDDSLGARLVTRMANRTGRSNGGKRGGAPWMSIAMKSIGWGAEPGAKNVARIEAWEKVMPSADKRRWLPVLKKVAETGKACWPEYAAYCGDPEIGDLWGDPDDKLAPLAVLLCHELAHVIDYNAGAVEIAGKKYGAWGTGHGDKWRAIYRVLRNAYVATGAYKPAPTAEIIEFKPRVAKPARMDTFGLPLFDIAA